MSVHIIRSPLRAPTCAQCRRKLDKASETVWLKAGEIYMGNKRIIHERDGVPGTKVIHVWDGESYRARFGYFCTVTCAARCGQITINRAREGRSVA